MTSWLVYLRVLFVSTTLAIEKIYKRDSRWGGSITLWNSLWIVVSTHTPHTVISVLFNTEDIFSFFCHLLSPSLLFLKPKSLGWTKTVFGKCLSVLTGCEFRDRLLLANPAWALHHSYFENLSLAPSFSPSLSVREERDGPYERSGKRTFTIYNESESSMPFLVSETCCQWCSQHSQVTLVSMAPEDTFGC